MASASAPGKVILFGEHAVVYGEPAIATALDLRTRVTARLAPGGATTVNGQPLTPAWHVHVVEALRVLGETRPVAFSTESGIPSAAGMGSSAALSVATCGALLALGGPAEPEAAARAAYDVEWSAQGGRGSPTDTSTSSHGRTLLVDAAPHAGLRVAWEIARGERRWRLHELDWGLPHLSVVVGNTGVRARTADQVAKVARFVGRTGFAKDVLREIGDVAREALPALRKGDAVRVGELMERNHRLLAILGVSTPELDRLVNAVRPFSFGAKLTGSGGGGSMIALTDRPNEAAQAIRRAGGAPYVVKPDAPGVEASA